MGLKRSNVKPKIRVYGLDEELEFGKFERCTPREIIDDGEWRTLDWYIENLDGFGLDNEAHNYMSKHINGM